MTSCDGNVLSDCDANGNLVNPTTCSVACVVEPKAHCAYLEPKYLPDVCDQAAGEDLSITTSATLDTDLNTNCNGGFVDQVGAHGICVVRYRNITIEAMAELTVIGSRALALVGDESVVVHGTLNISATREQPGPGGAVILSGRSAMSNVGGGGAGFGSRGGAGGTSTTDGGAANAGNAESDPALLAALVGGTMCCEGGSAPPTPRVAQEAQRL